MTMLPDGVTVRTAVFETAGLSSILGRAILGVACSLLPMCTMTGDQNRVTVTANINVSVVPAVDAGGAR
jgi:hypothetical protein